MRNRSRRAGLFCLCGRGGALLERDQFSTNPGTTLASEGRRSISRRTATCPGCGCHRCSSFCRNSIASRAVSLSRQFLLYAHNQTYNNNRDIHWPINSIGNFYYLPMSESETATLASQLHFRSARMQLPSRPHWHVCAVASEPDQKFRSSPLISFHQA